LRRRQFAVLKQVSHMDFAVLGEEGLAPPGGLLVRFE
jgi:hypothetical protein